MNPPQPPHTPPAPSGLPHGSPLRGPVTAHIIANPSAGRAGRRAAIEAAAARWQAHGWTITWRWTGGPGDAAALARAAAAEGVGVVAVAGGDGTVNEVANGLAGTATALAVLPAGTANVLAAQLGLIPWPSPLRTPDLAAAADSLAAGVVRRIDLGYAEPTGQPARYFALWAGVGLDATIVAAIEGPGRGLKARFGALAYAWVALRTLARDRGGEAIVRIDGERRRGWLRGAILHNIPLYAGLLHLAPEARLDDGHLDAALFMGRSRRRAVADWLGAGGAASAGAFGRRVVLGRTDARRPLALPAAAVRIVSRAPMAVHVDAEPWGTTPVRVSVAPGALALVVPAGAPATLFEHALQATGLRAPLAQEVLGVRVPSASGAAGALVRHVSPAAVDR